MLLIQDSQNHLAKHTYVAADNTPPAPTSNIVTFGGVPP